MKIAPHLNERKKKTSRACFIAIFFQNFPIENFLEKQKMFLVHLVKSRDRNSRAFWENCHRHRSASVTRKKEAREINLKKNELKFYYIDNHVFFRCLLSSSDCFLCKEPLSVK